MLGAGDIGDALIPCTPAGSMLLIERVRGRDLSGLHAVVVGRSNIVGKPMANLLLAANCHRHHRPQPHQGPSGSRPHRRHPRRRGRPPRKWSKAIGSSQARPLSTSASTEYRRPKGEGKYRLVGDVAFDDAAKAAGAITPVPGGVGPMTIALLMANTLASAYLKAGMKRPTF